jgi:hypothetical protein
MANHDGFHDPLLDVLCGTKAVPVKYGPKDYFKERGVYDLSTNFPYLGRQLAELRKHNMEQSPRKLSELWKDRRNPVQYFAFWATIIIGGLALFLSLLQALLSIGQLVVSIRQSPLQDEYEMIEKGGPPEAKEELVLSHPEKWSPEASNFLYATRWGTLKDIEDVRETCQFLSDSN